VNAKEAASTNNTAINLVFFIVSVLIPNSFKNGARGAGGQKKGIN